MKKAVKTVLVIFMFIGVIISVTALSVSSEFCESDEGGPIPKICTLLL